MKKMNLATGCLALLLSQMSVANTAAELKITSFSRVTANDNTNVTAEVCGTLTGHTQGPHLLRLTTDYNTNNPNIFYTWVGQANAFCAVVTTYQGVIQAELEVQGLTEGKLVRAQAKL